MTPGIYNKNTSKIGKKSQRMSAVQGETMGHPTIDDSPLPRAAASLVADLHGRKLDDVVNVEGLFP
jgi:hypothetical protein